MVMSGVLMKVRFYFDSEQRTAIQFQFPSRYKVIETDMDGSCLFAAIANQLGCPLTDSGDIRRDLIHYARQHKAEVVCYISNIQLINNQ